MPIAGLDRSVKGQEHHMGWRDPDVIISLFTDMVLCEDVTEAPIKVFACTHDQVSLHCLLYVRITFFCMCG